MGLKQNFVPFFPHFSLSCAPSPPWLHQLKWLYEVSSWGSQSYFSLRLFFLLFILALISSHNSNLSQASQCRLPFEYKFWTSKQLGCLGLQGLPARLKPFEAHCLRQQIRIWAVPVQELLSSHGANMTSSSISLTYPCKAPFIDPY